MPFSATAGQTPEDGTLYAQPGDTIQVGYTDPVYGDSCSAAATIAVPSQTKTLYFNAPGQGMDRIVPSGSTIVSTYQLGTGGGGGGTFNTIHHRRKGYLHAEPVNATGYNYGGSTTLPGQREHEHHLRQLPTSFMFDMSSIPLGATINSATLNLYKTAGNNTYSTGVYRITSDWTEGAWHRGRPEVANWTQRMTATNWGTAGGDYNAQLFLQSMSPRLMEPTTGTSPPRCRAGTTARFQITACWSGGQMKPSGPPVPTPSAAGTNATVADRPTLTVNYTLPATIVTNTTFVQTSPMAANFSMPAGGQVTVTTYIRVASGTLPTPLPVSVALETGGSPFLTISSNPTVTHHLRQRLPSGMDREPGIHR